MGQLLSALSLERLDLLQDSPAHRGFPFGRCASVGGCAQAIETCSNTNMTPKLAKRDFIARTPIVPGSNSCNELLAAAMAPQSRLFPIEPPLAERRTITNCPVSESQQAIKGRARQNVPKSAATYRNLLRGQVFNIGEKFLCADRRTSECHNSIEDPLGRTIICVIRPSEMTVGCCAAKLSCKRTCGVYNRRAAIKNLVKLE